MPAKGLYAVEYGYRYGFRVLVYAHDDTRRWMKRDANRAFRRQLKRELAAGAEAVSELMVRRRYRLTGWDVA